MGWFWGGVGWGNPDGPHSFIYLFHKCSILFKYRIIPESAHSAYDKAAQYFKIKLWRVPVNKEYRADVKEIRRYINRNTILV